jgi:hypothetical protein
MVPRMTSDPEPGDLTERGEDRRRRPTPMLSRFLLVGRRAAGRRDGERRFVYVDRPGVWIVLAFAAILALSLFDAWFTLELLKRGAEEANPVMRAALDLGDSAFVLIKTTITILATGFLCLHKNWPLGRLCLGLALVGYTVLTGYHLYAQHLIATI